jgi:hypothetical protein
MLSACATMLHGTYSGQGLASDIGSEALITSGQAVKKD